MCQQSPGNSGGDTSQSSCPNTLATNTLLAILLRALQVVGQEFTSSVVIRHPSTLELLTAYEAVVMGPTVDLLTVDLLTVRLTNLLTALAGARGSFELVENISREDYRHSSGRASLTGWTRS